MNTCPGRQCNVPLGDDGAICCYRHWLTLPVEVRDGVLHLQEHSRGSNGHSEAVARARDILRGAKVGT